MIVVIFESWPKPDKGQAYLEMGQRMMSLVEGFDGFISIERFESVVEPGKFVALSFWRDEAAVAAWRNVVEHRRIQDGSRKSIFDDYHMRVAEVIRDYSMTGRAEAPADSVKAHG
ncbi:antibiotic biosynthesis monooxygenase family protein [Hoeflea poritis]|uniref:Antibiotic biosynthesis monooxygenase n=1 Tax=Hoeflea poritis TaxID=2993659 RepID=A0ABT4VJF4_9HYPH|nr:antibiotic biosynthesis monooxygenase [Hoeflea poritis]MDA4844848.1 antibiotic biosynthesis monooxygenase [Hoeflea poritis]